MFFPLGGEEIPTTDEDMYDGEPPSTSPDDPNLSRTSNNNASDTSMDQPPVYIPEDVVLPPEFELSESRIEDAGLGVFSLVAIAMGEKFGPFVGEERSVPTDTQYAWEVSNFDI